MVKMAASDDDSRSEVSEILASCDNTSPKKKEPDMDQNSETSSDPFENCSPVPSDIDEEDVRQSVAGTKKHSFGKTWKNNKGEYIRYRCYDNNVEYKIGDNVFIESQRPDQPFYICNITEFKKSKRDAFVVVVRWFYRTTEVPETVYNFLIKDRYTEHGMNAIHDPLVKSRELFISNATDQFPINVLRGKCAVTHCTDIMAVKQFHPDDDAFFYTLSYNPETRRLASTQGEIRVGTSHQAKLPPWEGEIPPIGRPDRYEELSWEPGRTHDHDLLMYLRAARSMAAFAGMCDGGSTDDGCFAASKDDTTANALDVLHECDYDTGAALQKLVEDPVPVGHDKQWTEDETRRFIKGLRIHGKNFYKIRTEFLPEKDTGELITFYYLWKKTPGAAGLRPRGRRHRPAPAVLQRKVKTEKAGAGKKKETSSASEVEDSEGENSREQNPYYCRHCSTTTSKDWHHGGKDMKLLCTACRQYYKRYGEMPLLPGTARSQFTFRPISPEGMAGSQEDEDSEGRGLDNRLSPVSQEAQDRGEESDSGRSYTSSRSESGSRSPEEDGSRATTPGTGAQSSAGDPAPAGNSVKQPMLPPATAVSAPAEAAVDTSIDLNASQTEPHNLSVGGQSQPPTVSVLPSVQVVPSLSQPPATLGAPLPPPLFSQPGSVVGDQPLALPLTSGARTPVDLSSPSPGPQPEVQVLEPEPEPPTTPHSPGPPSPELKIEDTECHRSQSAIFVRHYNRGEGNSCSRTDMFFKPVPDSKLARKREERLRRQEEKERKQEERSTSSAGSHPGMSPGLGRRPGPSPGHVTPGSYNIHELDRLEREKRERELAEHRDRENRMREELLRRGGLPPRPGLPGMPPHDPYLEASRRYAAQAQAAAGLPSPYGSLGDRMAADRMAAERLALATDPLVRLQMAGINPEVSAHTHTHLHMHPDAAAAAALMMQHPGFPAPSLPGYRPPPGPFDLAAGFRPPATPPGVGADYLQRMMTPQGFPGPDALQRQLLYERERGLLGGLGAASLAASQQLQHLQQEEYLRQARDRENKVRALEEAARGAGPR